MFHDGAHALRPILDGSTSRQVAFTDGGLVISDSNERAYDLARLERVVAALVESHRLLQRENTALRSDIEEKGRHLHVLDGRLLEANQRRQDVAKRIDELIAQIDQLGAQLDAQVENLSE